MRIHNRITACLMAAVLLTTGVQPFYAEEPTGDAGTEITVKLETLAEAEKKNDTGEQSVTEKASEKVTEKVIEKAVEKITEKTTEKAVEKVTEKTTEKAVEKTTENTTENVTAETETDANEETAADVTAETAADTNEETAVSATAETEAIVTAEAAPAAEECAVTSAEDEKYAAAGEASTKTAQTEVDRVKKMIAALPELPDISKADASQIQTAQSAYNGLSTAQQEQLDTEDMGDGQPYGRILEAAVWTLNACYAVDASTTLPAGTYDATTSPALTSEYSKGKSTSARNRRWSVDQITVDESGKAAALISVESDTYTYIRTNGAVYRKTNESGDSQFAGVPIDLNTTFYISAFSTVMSTEIAFSITSHIDEQADAPVQTVELTGITLSESKLTMEEGSSHEALSVTYQPTNASEKPEISWKSDHPEIVTVNASTGEMKALSAGEAVITAAAGAYTASCSVEVTAKASQEAQAGIRSLQVSNNTAMFKGVDAYLETKNGVTILYVTLNGDGYRELFIGTYNQAVATGSDSSKWIAGTKRTDKTTLSYVDTNGKTKTVSALGKWQFAIPVSADVSYLQVQALSDSHRKDGYWWYPRQFVIDQKNGTLTVDDYHGNDALRVNTTGNVPEIESAALITEGGPHSNSYSIQMKVSLKDSSYTKAYLGKKEKAEENEKDSFAIKNKTISFIVEEILGTGNDAKIASRIGSPFALSLYDASAKKWIGLEVTIDQDNLKLTVKSFDKTSQDTGNETFESKQEEAAKASNSNTMPGAVDNSTKLPDGVYNAGQFHFSYSGGSGRVVINCTKVEIRNGKAYATITFSRSAKQGGSSNYDMLRASGQVYTGKNTFTIPVRLNKNNTIVGRTISMSAPHWVEYTIFISIQEPGKETTADVTENKKVLDEETPSIPGLSGGQEIKVTYTDKLKLFEYDNGYYLIEINIVKGSDRENEEFLRYLELLTSEAAEESAAEEEAAQGDTGEEESAASAGGGDPVESQAALLYANPVVKYLVVPEGEEAPAGLDKELVIITQPCEQTYVAAPAAAEQMQELSLGMKIDTIGLTQEILEEAGLLELADRTALDETDEKYLAWGGEDSAPEYRTLLKRKTDLMIVDGGILPEDTKEMEAAMKRFLKLGARAVQMKAALLIDRSVEEETQRAKAEWYKVYGIIYNCREEAEQAYQKIVG